jgi:hypothetical protein
MILAGDIEELTRDLALSLSEDFQTISCRHVSRRAHELNEIVATCFIPKSAG